MTFMMRLYFSGSSAARAISPIADPWGPHGSSLVASSTLSCAPEMKSEARDHRKSALILSACKRDLARSPTSISVTLRASALALLTTPCTSELKFRLPNILL